MKAGGSYHGLLLTSSWLLILRRVLLFVNSPSQIAEEVADLDNGERELKKEA